MTTDTRPPTALSRLHRMHALHTTLAALRSRLDHEAIRARLRHTWDQFGTLPPLRPRGVSCPLCGSPLVASDGRAGEVLAWKRCGGCGQHQYGEVEV